MEDPNLSLSVAQYIALGIALVALCVSGFVSGSEIAFFSLNAKQREKLEEHAWGRQALQLLAKPERLLATILIANNLVNVTIVILVNYALGPVFEHMDAVLSFILQTIIITFVILLFGEIAPKLVGNSQPLRWVRFAVPGLRLITALLAAPAKLLMKSSHIVHRVVTKQAQNVTTDDLANALEVTDVKADKDKEMLEGILRFGQTTAAEIMTPRIDITDIDVSEDYCEVLKTVISSGYSRLPVTDGSQDNIRGILYARDLLPYVTVDDPGFDWQRLLRQPYFVPESRPIDDLLEDFRRRHQHVAIVVDEFGGTQGLVTMEDVLEEIVGDIDDEYDDTAPTYRRVREDTFDFEGRTLLTDFFRVTDIDESEFSAVTEDAETIGGMLLTIKGDFPKERESIIYGGVRFTILTIEGHRIGDIRVTVLPKPQADVDSKDKES